MKWPTTLSSNKSVQTKLNPFPAFGTCWFHSRTGSFLSVSRRRVSAQQHGHVDVPHRSGVDSNSFFFFHGFLSLVERTTFRRVEFDSPIFSSPCSLFPAIGGNEMATKESGPEK